MNPERTITLNGQQVQMIYCTATENGYEKLADNSIAVFFPTFGKDKKGRDIITEPASAKTGDYITLAMAAIVAAYAKADKEPPIDGKYILYEANPQERAELLTAIREMQAEWYNVPKVVADTLKSEAADNQGGKGKGKNV